MVSKIDKNSKSGRRESEGKVFSYPLAILVSPRRKDLCTSSQENDTLKCQGCKEVHVLSLIRPEANRNSQLINTVVMMKFRSFCQRFLHVHVVSRGVQ